MIFYVVPSLQEFGGIQEFARSVYSELYKDYEIQLLNWKETKLFLLVDGVLERFPPKLGYFFYSQSVSPRYRKKYTELKKADLIHFWHLKPAVSFLDKRYIVSCHGREILQEYVKGFKKVAYPKILGNALYIHVNSHFTQKLVTKNLKQFDALKIRVISPCLPFEPVLDSPNRLRRGDGIIIGTLTRFNRRKNILNIIESLGILKEKYGLDFKYYLAGDGLERNRILARLKKVNFDWKYFGMISKRRKLEEFYPQLDIFVMPTLGLPNDVEGFGIVYLEANAYGIPVVASKVGGVSDAVEENTSGVFADPTDPHDIAIKILDLVRNREKYTKTARQWAKRFDRTGIAKKFAEMYDELL